MVLWGMVGACECECNSQMLWYSSARNWMDVDVYKIKLANLLVTGTMTYTGTVRIVSPLFL
jgi:hypothetical protein